MAMAIVLSDKSEASWIQAIYGYSRPLRGSAA